MADAEPTSPTVAKGSTNKPLPRSPSTNGRPGTSGTELGLRADRENASSALERAQRAEAAYRAKRRATYARRDYQAAKEHFKNAGKSLIAGSKHAWLAITAGPAIVIEKKENFKKSKEMKDREKVEKKGKLWEEKAKKKSVDDGTDGEEASPATEAVAPPA